jgi:hypothetical protein
MPTKNPEELEAGDAVVHDVLGSVRIIGRRKSDDENHGLPGWWLDDSSGLADYVLEADWTPVVEVLDERRELRTVVNELAQKLLALCPEIFR